MSSRHDKGWDRIYHSHRPECLPWELSKPRQVLAELVDSGRVLPCRTLDLCCGAGTNPIYLAEKGFSVTALDISDGAVKFAKDKAQKAQIEIDFLIGDFLNLPFRIGKFDFAFDFGCFHHVQVNERVKFIKGIYKVLGSQGTYFLACFSEKNGPGWNHFTKEQISRLFGDYFDIEWIRHVSSVESNGVKRHFYEALMEKTDVQ